ncbi:MAG: hypothetical protein IH987_21740 [Planctomycetes bacterium]|nr:hypothetical protein [Planctomycetota bacterium]
MKFYSTAKGTIPLVITLSSRVRDLSVDPSGSLIAIVARGNRSPKKATVLLTVHRIVRGKRATLVHDGGEMPGIGGLEFSKDSRYLLVRHRQEVVILGTDEWGPQLAIPEMTRHAEFSSDAQFVLVVPRDSRNRAAVWNIAERRRIAEIPATTPVAQLASLNGWILHDHSKNALVFWSADKAGIEFTLDLPAGMVCRVLAADKNNTLAAFVRSAKPNVFGNYRSRILIWDLNTRALLHELKTGITFVMSMQFLESGSILGIAGTNSGVRLVNVHSGGVLAKISRFTGYHLIACDSMFATWTNESVALWDMNGLSPVLVWEDRWRAKPFSWLE